MRWLLQFVLILAEIVVESLHRYLYAGIACQHFCLFKEAGSNFRHAHVHLLGRGEFPGTSNPDRYTGLGHDDATPGLANPGDDRHNSVSRGRDCEFRPSPGDRSKALAPIDLQAKAGATGYFYPAPESGECAAGYFRYRCDCGDMCLTFNRAAFEDWQRTQ